ncbi:hypothetical protein BKA70DRAFT_1090118, partial [Coprinopsis sp. MPI-PUGE-AT-0042]
LAAKSSAFSLPSPMAAKECMVLPPMLSPAMPVEAVMATSCSINRPRAQEIIARRRTDFPVPGGPVKKTLRPALTW